MNYGFSLDGKALEKLLAKPQSEQWRLCDLFILTAKDPFYEPELVLKSDQVHVTMVRVFGDVLVSYRVDHAVSKVMILDFEIISSSR